MVLDFIMLGRQEVDKTSPSRRAGPTLEVSQFDQRFVLAASMMVNSKEASRTLERSRFLLQVSQEAVYPMHSSAILREARQL